MSVPPGTLNPPPDAVLRLQLLRAAQKFGPAPPFYTGIRDEAAVNALIDRIEAELKNRPTKQFVLGEFSAALNELDPPGDTEDRERVCMYLEQIMNIVGLESSDGLLNTWPYGFDPS